MTTPHDEPDDIRRADESPNNTESRSGRDAHPENGDNMASSDRESGFAEDTTAEHKRNWATPDESSSRRAALPDYPAEPATSSDARREDMRAEDDPRDINDDEIRALRREEHASDVGMENPESERFGRGGADANGATAGEPSSGTEMVNLFVRNVAKHVMEQQLVDLFSKYGTVDSAVVVRDPHSKECRGFGFVKMCNEEGAKEVVAVLQEYDFEGRKISVERAKRSEPHSRTPGAYMGIDRRIRDRYAGMKRHRDYEPGRYPPYPPHYDMRGGGGGGGGGYRGRYYDPSRPRADERQWDYRVPYDNPPFDDRDRMRRRYNTDGPRYAPPRDFERDQRYREREPPVPRESADDYI